MYQIITYKQHQTEVLPIDVPYWLMSMKSSSVSVIASCHFSFHSLHMARHINHDLNTYSNFSYYSHMCDNVCLVMHRVQMRDVYDMSF